MSEVTEKDSAVVRFVGIIYHESLKATGWSWQRLNPALFSTVKNAIVAGMKFELEDLRVVCLKYQGGYWFGEGGIESFYRHAIEVGNVSACLSVEHFEQRPIYTYDNKRIFVGREFAWDGRQVICTSITKGYLVACGYKEIKRYSSGSFWGTRSHGEGKPNKVYKITVEDLKTHRKAQREDQKKYLQAWELVKNGATKDEAIAQVGLTETWRLTKDWLRAANKGKR